MGKTWSRRPSEIYGIHDDFQAFCFDRAVTLFGQSVEEDLRNAAKNSRNEAQAERKASQRLMRWLVQPGETPIGVFKDPAKR